MAGPRPAARSEPPPGGLPAGCLADVSQPGKLREGLVRLHPDHAVRAAFPATVLVRRAGQRGVLVARHSAQKDRTSCS